MKKAGKEKGFTLVEVVAVCAIIAVLASVVMASVSGVFPRSRQEVWRSSMKGLQAACDIFYAYWGVFPTYEGSVPSLQPCSGRPAVPLNWEARGGDGRRFRDYLRSLPPARAVEVGLTPPQQTLHYGVTGKGRVIATLVSPPWGPDTPVYVLEGLAPGTWATQPLASVVGSDGAGSTPLGGSGDDADFAAGEGEWPLEEALGVVVRDGDLVPETGPGWEDTSSLPVAVGGTAGVAWGDYLYFFGGQGHATGIQRLHVPSGEWEVQENVLPGPLSGAAAVNLQGKIYLLGGSAQEGLGDRVWRYDPPTGEWQALGCSLPGKVQWAGAAAAGDNIFLFGGTVNGLGTTGIVKVNPHTEEVSSVACSLPWPVSGITAVSWGEDIYLFGGSAQFSGFTGVISQILRFDPDTETLKDTGARTPTGAGQMAVAARADGIYVFGGVRGDYRSLEPVDMVCHFHPPSGVVRAFSPALSLSPPRWGAVAIPYEDKIYVAGGWVRRDQVVSALGCLGWRQGLPQPRQALPIPSSFVALVSGRAHDLFALGGMLGTGRREVWRLVPDEGRCDAAPGMATGLANVAAVRIGNRLYTFGGVTGWTAYDGRTAQVGVVDLDEGGGHSLGSLLPRACEGMAAVLLDGTVYLFGGWDGSRSLDQVLAFHPDTAIVETLPVRLPSGRHHVAAAAHDGRIWLFGGQAGTVPLDDVLLFTPGREGQPPSLQQVGRLPRPVSRAGAVSWGGELYVLGGFGSGGASPCIVRVEPAIPETSAEELPVRLPRGGGTAAAVLDGAIYLLQDGGSILRVVPRPRAALVFRAPAGEMGSAGEKVRWEVGAIEAEGQVHLLYSTSDDGSVWSPAVADPAELAPAHCFRVEVEFRPDPVRPARVRRIWGHVRPVEP